MLSKKYIETGISNSLSVEEGGDGETMIGLRGPQIIHALELGATALGDEVLTTEVRQYRETVDNSEQMTNDLQQEPLLIDPYNLDPVIEALQIVARPSYGSPLSWTSRLKNKVNGVQFHAELVSRSLRHFKRAIDDELSEPKY